MSVDAFAASEEQRCKDSLSSVPNAVFRYFYNNSSNVVCVYTIGDSSNEYRKNIPLSSVNCPAKLSLKVFYYPAGSTSVPTRVCQDGCTYEGGHAIDTPNYVAITMQATGDGKNCTNESGPKQPPQCDKTDPYGGCYVPPNDDCLRLKDGSIQCPNNQVPPNNNTCNGADYCKRPPEGCGAGYVPGSFNGQQLCVRSGPNKPSDPPKPDDPQDPNNCMNGGSYCPQPPDNESCPSGYTETIYNGSKICVKNNPDPEKPNPNDPNTDNGGGSSEPTDGGGDGGSINLKPVIDAINSLKAALLSAIDGVSKKLTTLIDGQKETNKKLDTSNDHLDKIEDSTRAASEAIGETNKKLDKIFSDEGKDQIEQLGEQSSDPRYAQAEAEATTQVQKFANVLSYTSSHACISDLTITNIPLYGSMTVPLSKWCDLLALVKILMKLAVLMLSLRMIDATVRAF
ncbi:hypothetical protein MMP74_19335 [Acinetobacter sp. NIPH 1869]|uniref:hypothetical protein n=1 Tax=Acinetobacter higginsii TaxID=70347 RepID=UPI001F4AF195|nr:hypothetical protein [Acinetobacter higginsii]MCH7306489.1 hypothetical protein [Acinetobacter higginsii]